MARSTQSTDPTRKAAFASGVFYLITFAASIPAALLLAPILTDPGFITGTGGDTQILVACVLDFINAITAIGSAVAVYSVLRRSHESLALGFVATRLLEAAIIVPGICALLAVTSIRQAGAAAGTDDAALIAVGQGLVGFRNWTFILGPGLIPGFNALLFATVLYRFRLVPRWIPALGLIGAPLLITSATGVVLGLHQLGSAYSAIATAPIFVWELSVGLWMTFKGFNRNATQLASGSTDEAGGAGSWHEAPARPAAAAATATSAPAPARFARLRFRPQRRHLLVVAGLWLAVVGNAEAKEHGVGIATVILFSLIPSLPLLLGLGQPKRTGHLAVRVVRPFNATNEPLLAITVFGLGALGILPPIALAGGLVWLGSIVVAWGFGNGLRETDGALRGGLSRMTSMRVASSPSRGAAAA
ncbi:MAG TPA: DUF4386 domain-containing protein [Candidatus Limnocylindrales bacterium]|nr:DUF4386 domain-containing protein [Candidatus Limnocylindrales bacterium]